MLSSFSEMLPTLALWALLLPSALATLLPQFDPFYNAPAGYAEKAPGTILRTRRVLTSYLGIVPNPVEAWQILYRTTAINGTAIAAATTVFRPLFAKNDRFVSFQTAYDGAAESGVCDPSFNYQLFAPQVDLISSVEFFLVQAFILQGYIVQVPDYEGPDAAFSAGRLSGMGVLDSMRAISNFRSTLGLKSSRPKIVGHGYSGGAIATGWAASLHANYAPELNVVGWTSGGTPANLTGTAVFSDGTLFAGFLPQAFAGLTKPSAYGAQLNPIINSIVTPKGRSAIDLANHICGAENIFAFPFGRFQGTDFQSLGDRFLYEPTIAAVLGNQTMGLDRSETPKAPVYLYHALNDEIIPFDNAMSLHSTWCADGASVHFATLKGGGHATTDVLGFPGAFQFVKSAFAGTLAKGCSQETLLDETLNPLALGLQAEPIVVQLLNALAIAGPQDSNIKNNIYTLNETVGA